MSTEEDLGIHREKRWLGEENRSHYIPSWYEPHHNLDILVKHLGVSQGFTIRQVLPFRRFALDESGNTVNQRAFKDLYVKYLMGFKVAETLDPRNEAIPNVYQFVRMKFDRVGSLVDMFFEDDGAITKTEKYTQDGEIAPGWMLKNQEQAASIAKMEMLSQLAQDGVLTPEQFQARVVELLSTPESVEEEPSPLEEAAVPPVMFPRKRGRPPGSKKMKPKPVRHPAQTAAVIPVEQTV